MKKLLFSLLLAGATAMAAEPNVFNGVWVIDTAEMNGQPIAAGDVPMLDLELKDGAYVFRGPENTAKGKVTVDMTKTPIVMDVEEVEGQNPGAKIPAIAELTATGFRAAYSFQGSRPSSFKTSDGDGVFIANYKRKPGTEPAVKPLRALLLLGGCCHDYAKQKDLLKAGLEARANLQIDIIYSPDGSTKPPLAIYGKPDYAQGYDVVIHDECAADQNNEEVVKGVLQPHRDGMPGVNLHCAMHSYRIGNPNEAAKPGTPHGYWFDYLGLQSSGHGPQKPITVTYTEPTHPITKGLGNWVTINEELYNNLMVWGSAKPLARGVQGEGNRVGTTDSVVAWTHEYGPKKARVFSTTIGHNNETVADPRYLDLVTRGLLWSCGKLTEGGQPMVGFGVGGK
jgi:uncharacterized protein (TIGR03067 family)